MKTGIFVMSIEQVDNESEWVRGNRRAVIVDSACHRNGNASIEEKLLETIKAEKPEVIVFSYFDNCDAIALTEKCLQLFDGVIYLCCCTCDNNINMVRRECWEKRFSRDRVIVTPTGTECHGWTTIYGMFYDFIGFPAWP